MRALSILATLAALTLANAQSSNSSAQFASSTPTAASASVIRTTSSFTSTGLTRSGASSVPFTTVLPTTFNVTITPTPTSSASATSSSTATPTPAPIALDTRVDPAFGVLGALLILTGLPSAFWGHKNRWTSFFLIGFYTLSLTCIVLILKFGVLAAVNPPSETLRGMFVLSCAVAGVAGGAVSIFFWKSTRYFIGAWGGFAFALFIQCFRNGGLIRPIGIRWIMYIGCAVVGFVLCTIPKIHYHVLLIATAFVGASAFMLGVDCFTTAGLKEFYIWNIGFEALFTKFTSNGIGFPVSQTMQIELGLLGAVALMGMAVQHRVLQVLQRKLGEIQEEQRKRDIEAEAQVATHFEGVLRERDEWEREHGSQQSKYGRAESTLSGTPLLKDQEPSSPTLTTPGLDEKRLSYLEGGIRARTQSGVSDFMNDPRRSQSPGALPTLDLGSGIGENVPDNYISSSKPSAGASTPDLQAKEDLLTEIATIRKSIDALRSESPSLSSQAPRSRHVSGTSRRTLSQDLGSLMTPGGLHTHREEQLRGRVQSMEMSTLAGPSNASRGAEIDRPSSVPLRDSNWDQYVQDRKILQPPSGVTPPISTATIDRIVMPAAVSSAVASRQQRERALELGEALPSSYSPRQESRSPEGFGITDPERQRRERRTSLGSPVNILPPRAKSPNIAAPVARRPDAGPRTKTFEELTERHRELMRNLQAPVTQAEREAAELEAAKSRWERSKAIEKQATTKRQAEKAAQLSKDGKKHRQGQGSDDRGRKSQNQQQRPAGDEDARRRSLSADKLAALGGAGTNSKRMSSAKVMEWQTQQQDAGGRSSRQGLAQPFPEAGARGSQDRRRSGAMGRTGN